MSLFDGLVNRINSSEQNTHTHVDVFLSSIEKWIDQICVGLLMKISLEIVTNVLVHLLFIDWNSLAEWFFQRICFMSYIRSVVERYDRQIDRHRSRRRERESEEKKNEEIHTHTHTHKYVKTKRENWWCDLKKVLTIIYPIYRCNKTIECAFEQSRWKEEEKNIPGMIIWFYSEVIMVTNSKTKSDMFFSLNRIDVFFTFIINLSI